MPWYSLFLPRSANSIVWLAILAVLTISLLALIGGFLDIALLTSFNPLWIRMSVITAVCFILASVHLVLLQISPSSLRRFKVLQVPAVLVSLVGLLTVALYSFALVTGREPSFGFAPFLNVFWAPKTRLALLTAINFLIGGSALLLLANGSRWAANIAHGLIIPGAMASYLVLISYLLGVQAWHGLLDVPMALNTALAFIALGAAILSVRPDTWLMTVLRSDHAGGTMARRLLPALLMIPFLIGWLRLYGERSGLFTSEVGVALVVVAYTFCLLSLVLLIADSLNRADSTRWQVEKALLESDQRFRAFMDNSPAIAWAKDEHGRYAYLSKACEDRFGIRLAECRGKTDFDLWPQAIAGKFRKNDLEVLASGQTIEVIEENIDRDGRTCFWWNFKFPFLDATGGRYVGGVGVDITERQQAEEALRQSEVGLAEAQRIAHLGNWEWDIARNELTLSDEIYRILGFTPQESRPTREDFLSWVHPDDLPTVIHKLEEGLKSGNYGPYYYRIMRSDDSIRHIYARGVTYFDPDGQPQRLLGTVQDVTELKQAEEENLRLLSTVQAERDRLSALINSINDEVWFADAEGQLSLANPQALREFRLGPAKELYLEELVESLEVYRPDGSSRPREESPALRALKGEIIKNFEEIVHTPATGGLRYRQVSSAPVRDNNGDIIGSVSVVRDITELKNAEKALRQSKDELEQRVKERTEELRKQADLLDLAHDAIIVRDMDSRVIFWSRGAEETYGFTKEEAWGRVIHELLHTKFSIPLKQIDREIRQNGHWHGELWHTRADGSCIVVACRQALEKDERGTPAAIMEINRDITERVQAEEKVRESEKRLRFLTAKILTAQEQERKRIAMELHEGLAQSMTTLKMFLRSLQRHLPAKEGPIKEDFDAAHNLIITMIEEARRISKGLSPALLENLGLTAALKHLFKELSKYQKIKVNVVKDKIENLFSPQTEINLFRIFQESLSNIAKHARATQVFVSIKRRDGRVDFLIKDNGEGFDLQKSRQGKSADKGMGLAAMDERLRMIGTRLNIMSQPGMGTEISFSIPIDAE